MMLKIVGLSGNNFRCVNFAEFHGSTVFTIELAFAMHQQWFWMALKEMQSFQGVEDEALLLGQHIGV